MKKFFVTCRIQGTATCAVEAENEKMALEKASASIDLVKDWDLDEWDIDKGWRSGSFENFEVIETEEF